MKGVSMEDKIKVVSYNKINGVVGSTITVFKGNYNECLKFYINNKTRYRKKNEYLELMYDN